MTLEENILKAVRGMLDAEKKDNAEEVKKQLDIEKQLYAIVVSGIKSIILIVV